METLEELKAIVDNAPEEATHIDIDGDYIKSSDDPCDFYFNRNCWFELYGAGVMRSLSDIKRIIELMGWQLGVEKKYRYILENEK